MGDGEPDIDPRGLIREVYRMEIGPAECRSIFLDWALGLPVAGREEIARLLAAFGPAHPMHPMTAVLREGVESQIEPAAGANRRGRRRPRAKP